MLIKQNTHWRQQIVNHPAYRRWIIDFIRALFDFNFTQVVTVKMLPLLYGLGIIAVGFTTVYLILEAIFTSPWQGLLYLFLVGPLFFFFGVAMVRTALEFCSAVFRIQSCIRKMEHKIAHVADNTESMNKDLGQLSAQMESLNNHISTLTHVVEEFEGITDRIPFLKKTTRKNGRPKRWAEAPLAEQFDLETIDLLDEAEIK